MNKKNDKIDFQYTLKYINELINNKINEETLNSSFQVKLSIAGLREIRGIVFTLAILSEKEITAKSYRNKVNAYNSLKEKALEEFGIKLENTIPFSNPSELFKNIDLILIKNDLTDNERNDFFIYRDLSERPPKKTKKKSNSYIMVIFNKITEQGLKIEDLTSNEELYKTKFSVEEEYIIMQGTEKKSKIDTIIISHSFLNYNKQNIQHINEILEQTF